MELETLQQAYRRAFNFCARYRYAGTPSEFKQAAEEWRRFDRGGLTAHIAHVTLRAMERGVFGNEVYLKSEIDKVVFGGKAPARMKEGGFYVSRD